MVKMRQLILKHLPKGYDECMTYGMIGYVVPLKTYPEGYLGNKNIPIGYLALASQKNYMALYLMNVYADKKVRNWFTKSFKLSGKKLNLGKSCLRFKTVDDLPLDVIAQTVALTPVKETIARYDMAKGKRVTRD